ncbi:hypothetical protein BT63DRAFT_44128 [Microthyrium microscopicum]|uniref:UBX domain-containing protein n=1 Tax=Microthyrium microscopicum TaxID=703497 RepID=A0A6A6U1Y4_9PEZI|nr:hypothetical protein BT63DRAFT_44128 [Microthyrium microscopicum]
MDDENLSQFITFTGASTSQAEQYLRMSDGNVEAAVTLFLDNPTLVSEPSTAPLNTSHPVAPAASAPARRNYNQDASGVIQIDSDEDDLDEDDTMDDVEYLGENPAPATADDAEIARRLQEEMYSGGGRDPDSVRAPIERTRETLVGGDDYDDDAVSAMIQRQLRRQQGDGAGRRNVGIFNQRDTQSSVWVDDSTNPAERAQNLSYVTGGASERSARAQTLAEMFRPPFELMSRLAFEDARDEGKEKQKWILVNVQDPSVFDCQVLNRDLWKDKDVAEMIKENFIFLQYANDDPRGAGYIQYYLANNRNDQNAFPHIAIVDPRTGEQVKVWSGPPAPKKPDFLMQLYEFLDRYSLDVDSRNPIAKRKPERKDVDIGRMTEDQMLEMAMQNSLAANASGPAHEDPDELTKSITIDKGKASANGTELQSPFAAIPSDQPHTEPSDPSTTTRIQFRYSGGRTVRRFSVDDPVRRIYEWLKAEPLDGKAGLEFDLMLMGKNLINSLDETIGDAGLKNASVMVEFAGGDDE